MAARAYVAATHDSVNGSAQKSEDFAKKVHEAFAKLTPPGVAGTGTYTDRDPDGRQGLVWKYVRDTILKDTQKFNATLNVVLNSGLSGISHDEKVNIAVAYHLNKIKDGDNKYDFKGFDSENKWRLFKAWYILKDTEKVAPPQEARHPTDEMSGQDEEIHDTDNEGFITDSSGSNKSTLNSTTRGKKRSSYQGRDAAKKDELRASHMDKKIKALDTIAATEKSKLKVIHDLKLQVQAQNMIAMLSHPTVQGNQALSDRMMSRIMAVMGVDENENEEDENTNNNNEIVTMLTAEEVATEVVDEIQNEEEQE
jgi:hypothetical protein